MNLQLVVFLGSFFVFSASAQTVLYMGKEINLVVPSGQCLAGSSPLEVQLIDSAKKAMEGYNYVLGVFADCKEISQLRKGKSIPLSSFGQITAQTPNGKQTSARGLSRNQYTRLVAGDPKDLAASVAKMKIAMQSRSKHVASTQSLGALKFDDMGAYLGFLLDLPNGDGTVTPGTGIGGITVVRDTPVSINFYRRSQSKATIQKMLVEQSETLKNFVKANP